MSIEELTANWGHRWLDIYSSWQTRTWWNDRQKCVCVTKCDSFQCMLMRIWTCGPVINFWIVYCGSLFSKHVRGNLCILTHCVQHVICMKMGLMSTTTWPSINNERLSAAVYLFSALVRLPVHSFTSRGHSQGHSHSFCSILRKMGIHWKGLFAGILTWYYQIDYLCEGTP